MTANPHRGEVTIEIAGRTRTLRPTMGAMAAIEQAFGDGLVPVVERYLARKLTLRETAIIVREGLVAAGESPTPELKAVMEHVFEAGPAKTVAPITRFLGNMLNGGQSPAEGNEPAAEGS